MIRFHQQLGRVSVCQQVRANDQKPRRVLFFKAFVACRQKTIRPDDV